MRNEPRRGWRCLGVLLAVPLAFSAIVYYPITRNYFHEDDFLHLYQIANRGRLENILSPHAGHLYLTRNAVFMALAELFGGQPTYYFWVALVIHVANVALLFLVVRVLTGNALLASFGATLWGISPLNEGALGWFSVHGQVYSTLAILAILYGLARSERRGERPGRGLEAFWYVAAFVAATTFGTGLGVALALPFSIALLHPPRDLRGLLRTPLLPLVAVLPILRTVVLWIWTSWTGRPPVAPRGAAGSVVELATQAATALVHLLTYGVTQLVAFCLYTPADYPDAVAACTATAFAGALAAALLRSSPAGRRRLLAFTLLVLACYGSIAAGRSWLFATLGTEVATALRYHYTGSLLLTLLLCLVLAGVAGRTALRPRWQAALLAAWLVFAAGAYVARGPAIDHHAEERRQAEEILRSIRAAIRRAPEGGDVYVRNGRFQSSWFWRPVDFPGWAGLFVVSFPDNVVDGRRVHFVTRNRGILEAAPEGKRSATLFVDRFPGGGGG